MYTKKMNVLSMGNKLRIIFALFIFLLPIISMAESIDLESSLSQLSEKSYKTKAEAIENIANSQSPKIQRILESLMSGKVYYRKSDKTTFYYEKNESGYHFEDILSGENFVLQKKRGYKKVGINNKLRIKLRQLIAELQLNNPDVAARKSAVEEIIKKLNDNGLATLKEYYPKESNSEVKELMQTGLSIGELTSDDETTVLNAIKNLEDNLQPIVKNSLVKLIENTDNPRVRSAAEKVIRSINADISFYEKLETLYFGLSFGSVLVLAGIGLAITFGVMGVINMAHGELIMIGAYTAFVIQQLMPNNIGMSIIVAIPAAFIIAGLVGILMERTVIRHLYGRPLETLLATFGISLILQQAVRTVFSPLNQTVITPDWMSGVLEINAIFSITWNRLYIIIFCLMVFAALMMVMKKTSLGLQVRAVSQNRAMARAMGVRSDWVDALTFGLGAGIAGVAGVALSLLTNVGPNLGQAYIIDSFLVVVFGGVGNLWGTLVAGMSLGVLNKLLEPWAGAVLAKIIVLISIILFIQKRPKGLFPQRGRAAEN